MSEGVRKAGQRWAEVSRGCTYELDPTVSNWFSPARLFGIYFRMIN